MAEVLTPQQYTAVHDRGGNLLVSAAAGSGKTKVLVDRLIGYLLDETNPAMLDEFLIITYTKAAAAELRGKIASKLNERIAQDPDNRHLQQQLQRLYLTKISTVHAFCAELLRESAFEADVSADFRVAEENECLQLQRQVMEGLIEDIFTAFENEDVRFFLDTQGLGRDDHLVPDLILKVYNSARCHMDPEKWLQWCQDSFVSFRDDMSQTPWGTYLIEDLRITLNSLICAMEKCADLAHQNGEMPKAELVLKDNLFLLKQLQSCESWDAVRNFGKPDFGRLTFPKKLTDPDTPEKIKRVRNGCKEVILKKLKTFEDDSDQIASDLYEIFRAVNGLLYLVREFSERYDRLKQQRRVLDFGDLEHKVLDLLWGKKRSGITAFAKTLSLRYREILVDEYQDSNAVQDAIFSALTSQRHNCFMVGDVKQSIYQFRLADPSIFLDKYQRFLPAENAIPGQDRKVLLSRNFRSCASVIDAVNDVFSYCMSERVGDLQYGEEEMLYEGIPHIPMQEPEVELWGIDVQEDTYYEESAFVAQRIRDLLDGTHYIRQGDILRPILPDDIVILLRSPGSVGEEFRCALEESGIRCETGSGADLLQTEEICVLRSLLQVLCNPLQDIPLVSVLSSRAFGFSSDELASIRAGKRDISFYEALGQDMSEKTRVFLAQIRELREEARINDVSKLLQKIMFLTRMDSIYGSMPNGDQRQKHLQDFYTLVSDWETNGHKELGRFLEYLDALEEKGVPSGKDRPASGAVTIMSIHKSKGLEFPVVFLCGLSRSFNQESARSQVLCHKDLGIGLDCINPSQRVRYPSIMKRAISTRIIRDSISEEMRVLYVAMTRARDRLIMTYARKNLGDKLEDLSYEMELFDQEHLAASVSDPGEWILQTAMRRTEAGAFFAISRKPSETYVSANPWRIDTVKVEERVVEEDTVCIENDSIDERILERIEAKLNYSYPYIAATVTPSKQTATQLKGRLKDQEIAEGTYSKSEKDHFRMPSFLGNERKGKEYGTLIHLVMQHIDFAHCSCTEELLSQVRQLQELGFITQEQASQIPTDQILSFLHSRNGKRILSGKEVLREFKFSILRDPEDPMLQGEKILLQGVIDCALVEEDGIVLVDFKTDYVTEKTISSIADQYTLQVKAYVSAIERIYEKPVKEAYLYFFRMNTFVRIA